VRDANVTVVSSNVVRNTWSYTSNYEQEKARGLQLTGMNRTVCDRKFTSVSVHMSVRLLLPL